MTYHRSKPSPAPNRGVTLPEMLVAVSITVAMLLMTGIIFKAAAGAAGKAAAHNQIMAQLRTLTRQLDQDFKGLRPDMPMAIIFEDVPIDTDGDAVDDTNVRQDRIVFYANGDFQDIDNPAYAGNLARIFYGHCHESHTVTADPESGDRYILTRRYKITHPAVDDPTASFGSVPEVYDAFSFENSHKEFWKTAAINSSADFVSDYFTSSDRAVSFVRRPNLRTTINSTNLAEPELALQKLYLLRDVGELKIEPWNFGQWDTTFGYAIYWNLPDLGGDLPTWNLGQWDPIGEGVTMIDGTFWWSEHDLASNPFVTDSWPKALRFTFTLYDKNRRHYPDGLTFSYIVNLPQR